MRRLLVLLALSLAVAVPAGAQQLRGAETNSVQASGLRGPESAPETPQGDLSALVPIPPPVPPIASMRPADSRQCRLTCAREYYFCLSADEESCPPLWTKCTARCGNG